MKCISTSILSSTECNREDGFNYQEQDKNEWTKDKPVSIRLFESIVDEINRYSWKLNNFFKTQSFQ